MPFNPKQICLVAEATGNTDGWSARTVQLDFGESVPESNLNSHKNAIDEHLFRCSFGLNGSDLMTETGKPSKVFVTGQNVSEAVRISAILNELYGLVPAPAAS